MQKRLSAVILASTLVFSIILIFNFEDVLAEESKKKPIKKKILPIKPTESKKIPKSKLPDKSKPVPPNEKSGMPTKDPIESTIVKRLQLGVKVGDKKNVATGDRVYVVLNKERGYLDYARNDFERNSYFKYDVPVSDVHTIADIKKIMIKQADSNDNGIDGVGIKRVELWVNEKLVYERTFSGKGGVWIGTNTLNLSGSELRQSQLWKNFVDPPPSMSVAQSVLKSKIEAQFGDFLGEEHKDYKWKSAPKVTKKDSKRIHVEAKFLDTNKRGLDSDVDMSFDMKFECVGDAYIKTSIENLKVKKEKQIPGKGIISTGAGVAATFMGGEGAGILAKEATKYGLEGAEWLLSKQAGGTSGVSDGVSFDSPIGFDKCYVRVDPDGSLLLVDPRS